MKNEKKIVIMRVMRRLFRIWEIRNGVCDWKNEKEGREDCGKEFSNGIIALYCVNFDTFLSLFEQLIEIFNDMVSENKKWNAFLDVYQGEMGKNWIVIEWTRFSFPA